MDILTSIYVQPCGHSIFIGCILELYVLKVTYHPLNSMNNFVTNKSKLPQDGAQVFPYLG